MATKPRKPAPEGFRLRINPYYGSMTPAEIARDVAMATGKWLGMTVLAFVYWLVMLLLLSIILLNVWKVSFTQILIWAAVLGAVSSLVYAYTLVHKRIFY